MAEICLNFAEVWKAGSGSEFAELGLLDASRAVLCQKSHVGRNILGR